MFKYLIYYKDLKEGEMIYTLIDDDFRCEIQCKDCVYPAIAKEYQNKKLNVGMNLALATLWAVGYMASNLKSIVLFQDKYGYRDMENWKEVAEARDKCLKTILVWK